MINILYFKDFIKENKDIIYPKRVSTVIYKKFFKELKEHVIWWFNNDILKKYYVLDSAEVEKRSCVVWFSDKDDDKKFNYKLKYLETEPLDDMEKMENCLMILKIYLTDTQELVKEIEQRVSIEYLNADYLHKTINKLKRRIVINSENEDEKDDFISKQRRHLSDNIY